MAFKMKGFSGFKSKDGYSRYSKDVNKSFNIIDSGNIYLGKPSGEKKPYGMVPAPLGDELINVLKEIIDGIGTINRRARLDWYLDKYPQQKKRLIRLICRIKGEKVYDETKEISEIKVKLEDVDMVINEVLGTMKVENVDVI